MSCEYQQRADDQCVEGANGQNVVAVSLDLRANAAQVASLVEKIGVRGVTALVGLFFFLGTFLGRGARHDDCAQLNDSGCIMERSERAEARAELADWCHGHGECLAGAHVRLKQ